LNEKAENDQQFDQVNLIDDGDDIELPSRKETERALKYLNCNKTDSLDMDRRAAEKWWPELCRMSYIK
jgi:hypothetical protein